MINFVRQAIRQWLAIRRACEWARRSIAIREMHAIQDSLVFRVPPGTYKPAQPIEIPEGITIQGSSFQRNPDGTRP